MMIRPSVTLLLVAAMMSMVNAQSTGPIVKDRVQDSFTPIDLPEQQLSGYLDERMKVNLEQRLLKVDEQAILDGFRHRPGKHPWIGEHAGKFLHAAANSYAYSHDARLKTLMDRVAHELIACQLDDGYLGTYDAEHRWTAWDVWVHKYDVIGLLRYYEVSGDTSALNTCRKIGDLLCRTFGDGQAGAVDGKDISLAGEHVGMAATSVLEPMCQLYRHTGEKRYLDFCLYITRSIEQHSKVISSLTEKKSVFGTANSKAYEMLSNLVGLVELCRITGDDRFLAPALNAWQDIVAHRLYITGTTSSKEFFLADNQLPAEEADHVGEGCVTVTWMQLNLSLLRLTGEAKYAEQLERTIYNHLLAAQEKESGDVCYFTPLNGAKKPTHKINCCLSSVPRGIAMIPLTVWGRRGDGIAINLYCAGRTRVGLGEASVDLSCQTDLPRDGRVRLTISSTRPASFGLYLRIPHWAGQVAIPDSTATEDGYRRINVSASERPTTIEFVLEPRVTILRGEPSYPECVAIQRGPQILCVDSSDTRLPQLPGTELKLDASAANSQYRTSSATGEAITLVPFAVAANPHVWLPTRK